MEQKTKHNIKIYLIIATILIGVSLFPALMMAMFSPMMFDSPGSENSILTNAIFISIITYPITAVLSIAICWILFLKQKLKASAVIILAPFLQGILIIVFFVLIEILCDGNFNC